MLRGGVYYRQPSTPHKSGNNEGVVRLTCSQFLLDPFGSFFHRFTSSTQALQISPERSSSIRKHLSKSVS